MLNEDILESIIIKGITLSDGKNVELDISLLISIKISRVGESAIFFYVVDIYRKILYKVFPK